MNHKIKIGLTASIVLAAGCAGAPEQSPLASTASPISSNSGLRPLVLLLGPAPGPSAPDASQYIDQTQDGPLTIPPNGEVSSSLLPAVPIRCQDLLVDLTLGVTLRHPRVADLRVSIATESVSGQTTSYDSLTIWDGAQQAAGKTPDQIAQLTLPSGFYADELLSSPDCTKHWVLKIVNTGASSGTLDTWNLRRRIAWAPMHDASFYTNLIFGDQTPSIVNYYAEESRGQFTFSNAGVFQASFINWRDRDDYHHASDVIWMLYTQGFDFEAYDANQDGRITNDELEVAAVDNISGEGGVNRDPGCIMLASRHHPLSTFEVCTRVAMFGAEVDFETLAHELSHSLGTVDLYARDCWSNGLTLMSCTIEQQPDVRKTIYHDPWHRTKLGWLSPVDGDFLHAGRAILGDESFRQPTGPSQPLRFRNPNDPTEYLLIEFRSPRGYDANISDTAGIAVWHVKEDGNGQAFQTSTHPYGEWTYAVGHDYPRGGHQLWHPSNGRFQLHWKNGDALPAIFWVEPHTYVSNVLRWRPPSGRTPQAPTGCVIWPNCGGDVSVHCDNQSVDFMTLQRLDNYGVFRPVDSTTDTLTPPAVYLHDTTVPASADREPYTVCATIDLTTTCMPDSRPLWVTIDHTACGTGGGGGGGGVPGTGHWHGHVMQ